MDFFDVVQKRFSYRKAMDQREVPLDDLKKMVQAGLDAPSGCNAQTTGFMIIRDPEIVEAIRRMPKANGALATAPAFIACHVPKEKPDTYCGISFDIEDCAAAVENILMAATALGYGSVWIDGWLRMENRAEEIAGLTGLSDDRIIRIILPIGKMTEAHARREKKSFDERVSII